MSDYLEPEPRYTRKATPEEIRASNRDPLVWFVVGVFTLFTCGALTHSPGVDECPSGWLRSNYLPLDGSRSVTWNIPHLRAGLCRH
jgi:hypothetical protein